MNVESISPPRARELPASRASLRRAHLLTEIGRPRGRTRFALVFAAAAVLGVAGTAIAVGVDLVEQQERFHGQAPDHPRRLGPIVEVASGRLDSGDEWALIAWKSESGICLDFAIPGNSPFGCGYPVRGAKPETDASGSGPPIHAVAGWASGGGLVGGDGKTTIFGIAAPEVEAVKVELRDGRIIDATMHDAPRELGANVRFFIVRLELPPQGLRGKGHVRAFRAYGRDGRLIERFDDWF